MTTDGIKRRGFASMSKERREEVARNGGRVVQARGTGHRWDADTASAAGKKGRAKQLETVK
jgi:general stress protein YciG